jgi:hypothetical protein
MKIKLFLLSIIFITNLTLAQSGGAWVPAAANPPVTVDWVRYDISGGVGEVRVQINGYTSAYSYFFSFSDTFQNSRANAFYSTFLTAQASGRKVYIYADESRHILAVQLGDG